MKANNSDKTNIKKKKLIIKYIVTSIIAGGVVTIMAMAPAIKNSGYEIRYNENGTGLQEKDVITLVSTQAFSEGFSANNFTSVLVDDDNIKWFLTDKGVASFDGNVWKIHNRNRKVPSAGLKDFAFDVSSYGKELWIASPLGATVVTLPVDARSGATTYYKGNSTILSDTVLAVAVGKGSIRWFGTLKGVSAFIDKKWLSYEYQRQYPEGLFQDFPITAIATTPGGDSVYVATQGAGVARLFKNDVDAISGASEYAIWGPIEMPSDNVYSICVTPDGTQWFGTDLGVARHIGDKTLEDWTIFTDESGLVNNFVNAIASDNEGGIWFGTKGGISILRGEVWNSFTETDGLLSNNIQCIAIDKEGMIWFGTDKGVISLNNGILTNFR